MLHNGLPLGDLGVVQRSPVQLRFHTLSGGEESNGSRRCADSAPRAFGFAEHVMGIWGRELYSDAEACAHLAGDKSFNHRVRVEFYDRCERARL
jgi:hypothetical protein